MISTYDGSSLICVNPPFLAKWNYTPKWPFWELWELRCHWAHVAATLQQFMGVTPQNHSFYPEVMSDSLLLNMAQSKQWVLPWIAWWIFPVRYVNKGYQGVLYMETMASLVRWFTVLFPQHLDVFCCELCGSMIQRLDLSLPIHVEHSSRFHKNNKEQEPLVDLVIFTFLSFAEAPLTGNRGLVRLWGLRSEKWSPACWEPEKYQLREPVFLGLQLEFRCFFGRYPIHHRTWFRGSFPKNRILGYPEIMKNPYKSVYNRTLKKAGPPN